MFVLLAYMENEKRGSYPTVVFRLHDKKGLEMSYKR